MALDQSIGGQIRFLDMSTLVETVLERLSAHPRLGIAATSLDDVTEMDHLARQVARELARKSAADLARRV